MLDPLHTPIPLVDLRAQYLSIQGDIDSAMNRVLLSTAFAGGPEVEMFEHAFAAYCGRTHCLGLSSGTAAIELLLRAYGIGAGDEVITVPNTFFATAEAVSMTGALPVFVDIDEETALMNPALLEAAITPKTKAIIPVHLYGQSAPMDAIMEIARRHGLRVIEDCAQAHGAEWKGQRAGTFGDAASFSFYPGKNLGAYGEAGAITTDDGTVAEFVRLFREHGSETKYAHRIIGRNERMDGLQGAVLGAKLPYLDRWNEARRAHATRYREVLSDEPRIRYIETHPDALHAQHLMVIRIPAPDRDRVRTHLNDAGIGAGIHYPIPLHLQECYRDLGHKPGDFPVAERLAHEILSLPLYPEMTEEQIGRVVGTLREAL